MRTCSCLPNTTILATKTSSRKSMADLLEPKQCKDSKVERRNGGGGVIIKYVIYVWGGEVDRIQPGLEELWKLDPSFPLITEPIQLPTLEPSQENDSRCFACIDEYSLKDRVWTHRLTFGATIDDMPQLGRGCQLVEINGDIYAFAGYNAKIIEKDTGSKIRYGIFSNDVYHLNMATYEWKRLDVVDNVHIPPPLYLCGTLGYKGKLCIFAGMTRHERWKLTGNKTRTKDHLQDGADCKQYGPIKDKYWTNEYFEFDVAKKEWSSPHVQNRPQPMGVITFTRINNNKAVIYAGNYAGNDEDLRSDNLYVFDLDTKVFTDSLKPIDASPSLEWAGKLTFHTATCLVNPDEIGNKVWTGGPRLTQKVLILWGKDDREHITSDIWILEIDGENTEDFTWRKLPPVRGVKPTAWHIAQPYYADGVQECIVVSFGGNVHVDKQTPGSPRHEVNSLRMFEFGVPSLRQLTLMVISSNKSLYDFTKADAKARRQFEQFNYRQGLEGVFPMFASQKAK